MTRCLDLDGNLDEKLDRALADGKITTADADEVSNFAAFLREVGQAGRPKSPDFDKPRFRAALAKHYPDQYGHLAEPEVTE